jgi:hypothetical protein
MQKEMVENLKVQFKKTQSGDPAAREIAARLQNSYNAPGTTTFIATPDPEAAQFLPYGGLPESLRALAPPGVNEKGETVQMPTGVFRAQLKDPASQKYFDQMMQEYLARMQAAEKQRQAKFKAQYPNAEYR